MKIREKTNSMVAATAAAMGCGCGSSGVTVATSSGTPHFENFPALVAELQTWEGIYDAFYRTFDDIDRLMAESLGTSVNSCIYGNMASKLYSTWEKKVLPFKNVYYKMKELSTKVTEAYQMDVNFQNAFNEGKGELIDPGEILSNLEIDPDMAKKARDLAALKGGNTDKLNAKFDESGNKYYEIDGVKYYVVLDSDGNISGYNVDGEFLPVQKINTDFGNTGAERAMLEEWELVGTEYMGRDDLSIEYKKLPNGAYDPQTSANLYTEVIETQQSVAQTRSMIETVISYLGANPDRAACFESDHYNDAGSKEYEILAYLCQQASHYSDADYAMEKGLAGGWAKWDGAFTNALAHDQSTYDVNGSYDVPHNAMFGGNADAYAKACNEASKINETLSHCDSMQQIDAKLQEMGFPPIEVLYEGIPEDERW